MLFTRIKTHAFFMFIVKTLITAIDKHEVIDYQYVKHSPDDMQTYDKLKVELANRKTSCNPFIVKFTIFVGQLNFESKLHQSC